MLKRFRFILSAFLLCHSSIMLASSFLMSSEQIDPRIIKSTHAVAKWKIVTPDNYLEFGKWPDDHRFQKIIVHVNNGHPVIVSCNGNALRVEPGETVMCERALDYYAGLEITGLPRKTGIVGGLSYLKLFSEGTVEFIMEQS